jgi:murein DD-endopeptidase MepM/ murein hydrolase activator NlpD
MRQDPKRRKLRKMHKGLDFGAKRGTPVYATGPAKVMFAGRGSRGVGICVILRHNDEWVSRYFHLSKVDVRSGQTVEAGQIIGRVGSTGRSTGPHLHFEVRKKGQPVDPGELIGTSSTSH